VQSAELNSWLRNLKVSSRTRNNFRGALSNLFSFAKQNGYLPRDTATAIDLVPKVKVQRKRPEIFSPTELLQLLRKCDDNESNPLKPWVVLGALCGLRSAEVFNLKWEDIRWAQGQIAVGEQNKTGYRFAPLTEAASFWLRPFKGKSGRIFAINEMPYQRLKVLCAKAEVVFKENAFRHSFGTYRTAATKNLPQVALEMGNSVQVIRSAYDAVMPESEALEWFNVGLLRKKAPNGVAK
jgi:integrase